MPSKKINYYPGDTITVSDPVDLRIVKGIVDRMNTAQYGMAHMAAVAEHEQKELWNFIHAKFPEVKKWKATYDHTTGEIMLKYEVNKEE